MYNERQYQKAYGQNMVLSSIGMLVLFFGLVWALGYALDAHFTAQDTMLCSSAKVSGNTEMLNRCATYYRTGDPKDIEEGR